MRQPTHALKTKRDPEVDQPMNGSVCQCLALMGAGLDSFKLTLYELLTMIPGVSNRVDLECTKLFIGVVLLSKAWNSWTSQFRCKKKEEIPFEG